MTLWSDFLRRLMVTATLSAPATAAAEPPRDTTEPMRAEIGERQPSPGKPTSEG
jgi:hypothetical protein